MLTASGMEGLWLRFQIVCPLWKLTVSFAIPPLIPGYQKGSIAVLKVTIWNLSFFKNKSKKDCAMKSHRLKNWSISPHLSHYSLTCKHTIWRSNPVSSISLAGINNLVEISFSDLLWRGVARVIWPPHLSPTDCQLSWPHHCIGVCPN